MLKWLALAGVIVAGQGLAQQPTVQQLFDAATALDATGKPAERLAAWEGFEQRAHNNRRSVALARLRKSRALLALGRRDEAMEQVKLGLADLPTGDPTLREDRMFGLLALGAIAQAALDYPAALKQYQLAYRLAETDGAVRADQDANLHRSARGGTRGSRCGGDCPQGQSGPGFAGRVAPARCRTPAQCRGKQSCPGQGDGGGETARRADLANQIE